MCGRDGFRFRTEFLRFFLAQMKCGRKKNVLFTNGFILDVARVHQAIPTTVSVYVNGVEFAGFFFHRFFVRSIVA